MTAGGLPKIVRTRSIYPVTTRRRGANLLARSLLAAVAVAAVACAPTGSPSPTSPTGAPSGAAGGTPGAAIPSPTSAASLDRAARWRADLSLVVPGMAAIHPNLTHGTTRAALDAAAAALAATIGTATDDQLMVGVLRIVAMVSAAGCDAHTGAYVWGSGTYPVDSLPLRLWLFPNEDADGDQVVVVDALPPYQALIGSRIDTVDGHPIAAVLAALEPIVPRDNAQTVRLLTPRFLLIPQVLRGLGLAEPGAVSLTLTAADGLPTTVDVDPVPMADYNAWAGPYGLHLPADPGVLYLSRIGDALWWQVLADGETLYVQYNRVDPLPAAQLADLAAALRAPGLTRVVLDVRHNYGGELSALDPMVTIFEDPAVDQHDRLYVVTGRNTFSGGSLLVARLDRDTQALIVGEPMGGCPTFYSDPSDLVLPGSGITVGVADATAVGVDAKDPRLTIEPDVAAVLSREEWAAKRDPALELFDVVAP